MTREHQTWVFDWNGTLVNDITRAVDATNQVLTQHGLDALGVDEFRARFRIPMSLFLTQLGIADDEIVGATTEWNQAMLERPCRLSNGAAEFLAHLHAAGAAVSVLTAASPDLPRTDADRLGIIHLIGTIIGNTQDKAQELRRQAPTGRCFYVGDTPDDIAAGLAAGVTTIAMTAGYTSPDLLKAVSPHAAVGDLRDLIK